MAARTLSALQRRRIAQAIRDGHLAYLAEMFGPTAIDPEDYDRLRKAGKIRQEKLLPQDVALAVHALGAQLGEQLNAMTEEVGREDVARVHEMPAHATARVFDVDKPDLIDPESFWRRLRDDPQVLMEAEREAVELLRDRIGQHIKGLGNKLDAETGKILVDVDDKLRRRRLTKFQRETARGINERAAAEEVAHRVRIVTGDLKRDWLRAAHTEMHNATEEAKAIVLAHSSPDRDPKVFKRPHGDACPFCKLLYLKPDGVTPRVFKLSVLLANGTNVGRRAGRPTRSGKSRTQWKATLGAVHPFCRCPLQVLPPGMGFDSGGQMVYVGMKKAIEVETPDEGLVNHVCEE